MHGLHLTADVRDCPAAAPLADREALRALCLRAVSAAGLTVVGELFHRFPAPGGVTGVVLLAESHLALHTWPELRGATLDVYVCNLGDDNSARAAALLEALIDALAPARVERQRLERGLSVRAGLVQAPGREPRRAQPEPPSARAAARPAASPRVNASSNTE